MRKDSFPPNFGPEMEAALSGSAADYYNPAGNNILSRVNGFYNWFDIREQMNTWQYSRIQESMPGPVTIARDESNRTLNGLNFASQDYLGLNSHPAVVNIAREALAQFGPHSAGSPMAMGHTRFTVALEEKLKQLTGMEHVLIFPTGWAAGFGSVIGLMRKNDHIVIDALAHACLFQGTYAAVTKENVHKFTHLDHEDARQQLQAIRAKDSVNGIMVITEGIFSMNADTPDLAQLQTACHEFNATLLVDVAHDLGAMGPAGTGQTGIQHLTGKIDLVMGSFSKSFASNGGFLATHSPAVKEYVKMYGGPYIFSNAISPIQAATALQAAEIILSAEGDQLRAKLAANAHHLRTGMESKGRQCAGIPCAIVPILVGNERTARIVYRLLGEANIAAMVLEFPVVPLNKARIRMQLMAPHTTSQLDLAIEQINDIILAAEQLAQNKY